jgi:hypothetical integral membrane protein (TIGR02206 family)
MTLPEFHPFGLQHLAALGVLAACCVLTARIVSLLSDSQRKWAGRFIGILLIGYAAVFYIRQYAAGMLSLEYSLPLDLCSVVLIAVIAAQFRAGRLQCEIAFFWGLGGTTQALITPDLGSGFPSWDFILFFWSHGAILLGIVFIIAATDFRPQRNSVVRMMMALNIYAAATGTVDRVMGWNYGYLCQKPAVHSLFDYLGPWPWYLLSLEGVALVTFWVLKWGYKACFGK